MHWLVGFAVVLAAISLTSIKRSKNNVCKTFEDYYTDRDQNENCYYNPDGELTVPEIIHRYGYPVESHDVLTGDGYTLTLFRIPSGKDSAKKRTPGKPILLQHGNSINSGCFVHIGRKSLGFILADAGYDVWLGNFRGTLYARNHTEYNDEDSKFWNFSFHEHGIYDLPAHIDYINKITGQKIIYMGYSMGGTAAYVYATSFPEVAAQKVKMLIGLAPAVFMQKSSLLTETMAKFWFITEPILQFVYNGPVSLKSLLPKSIQKIVCFPYPFQMKICESLDMLNMGFDYEQCDPETLPTTVKRNPDRTSIKTLTHFFQLVRTGKFQHFDYGEENNRQVYGSSTPPHYDLSKIKVPSYLISAENDVLITVENTKKLKDALPKNTVPYDIYSIKYKNFNHADYVVAKDAVNLLYNHLVQFSNRL